MIFASSLFIHLIALVHSAPAPAPAQCSCPAPVGNNIAYVGNTPTANFENVGSSVQCSCPAPVGNNIADVGDTPSTSDFGNVGSDVDYTLANNDFGSNSIDTSSYRGNGASSSSSSSTSSSSTASTDSYSDSSGSPNCTQVCKGSSSVFSTNGKCYRDAQAQKLSDCVHQTNPAWPFLPSKDSIPQVDPNGQQTVRDCVASTGAKASA